MTITATSIITFGGVLAVLVTLIKMFMAVYDFIQHNKEQDARIERIEVEMNAIRKEQRLSAENDLAFFDGFLQLGCNHSVPVQKQKLEAYLNEQAHK